MAFDALKVQDRLTAIAHANGNKFLNINDVRRSSVREALRNLVAAYGAPDSILPLIADSELSIVYAIALKDKDVGDKTVANLIRKYEKLTVNPISDPFGGATVNPISDPFGGATAKPRIPPSAPHDPTRPDMAQYVTREEIASYVDKFGAAVDERINMMRSGNTADLEKAKQEIAKLKLDFAASLPTIVAAQVADALQAATPTNLVVTMPGKTAPTSLGLSHFKQDHIIRALAAGVNVYLYGGAGTGKTTAGRKCADAFELPFYFAAKVESEYMLLGFKDARGETVRTQFREAYEHGGVFLFDELDGSSPMAVVALNAALANGICPFPDGVIARHKDFKCIAAGNTKLSGANRQYVGRSQLDAASIDRFAFIEFPIDEALETALAPNKKWCLYVQAVRKAIADRGVDHLVTPRATLDGSALLAQGFTVDEVVAMTVRKGLDDDTFDQIIRNVGTPAHFGVGDAPTPVHAIAGSLGGTL